MVYMRVINFQNKVIFHRLLIATSYELINSILKTNNVYLCELVSHGGCVGDFSESGCKGASRPDHWAERGECQVSLLIPFHFIFLLLS